ncbi:Z-ring formation inhibitor MciZ [Fictibacillus iocasae]|uniref:Z-ring formation inhibitor MciZ n=1 Tax=Fictibacillus iocasae TaxID=2715437 RepID=A0ABW2NNG6_9BACL
MKVYVQSSRVTLVGKGWQIKHMLKTYASQFETVEEWIQSTQVKNKPHLKLLP